MSEKLNDQYFLDKKIVKALLKERFLETAFNNTGILHDAGEVYEDALKRVDQWLAELPPADVKPVVRGKWEKDSDGVPHCTNCDSLAPQKLVLHIKTISCTAPFVQSKFCPNCGSYNGGDAE